MTRNVHSSCNNPFRPLMRWIVHIIRKITVSLTHLIKDSGHLRTILDNCVFQDSPNLMMHKCDIKGSFMSEKHQRLVELVGEAPGARIREEIVDSVDFILGSQFLELPEFKNSAFQVVIGSGMGLLSSDEISNFSFYQLVEKHVLTDSYKQEFGLKLWLRFKDDIFVVLDSEHDKRVEFWHDVRKRAEFFVTKVDCVSRSSLDMLDMVVYKGNRFAASGKLDIGAFVKTSHQGTSLSHRSGHHPSVHMSWPSARMSHFYRICTNKHDRRIAQKAFVAKLMADDPQHPMLEVFGRDSRGGSFKSSEVVRPSSWLVLPHHPCWQTAAIAAAIKACTHKFAAEYFGYLPRISWKNGGTHLWRTV